MKRTQLSKPIITQIIKDYSSLSQRGLATKYTLTHGVIKRILKENNVSCRGKHERVQYKKEIYTCSFCGNEFEDYTANRKNYKNVFCNSRCKGKFMSLYCVDENSPHWQGGNNPVPHEHGWRKTRNTILKADNFKCTDCGSTDNLQIHHKLPRALLIKMFGVKTMRNARTFMKNDLVTYCASCHQKHEKDYIKILGAATTMIYGTLYTDMSSWDSLNCAETYRGSQK